MKCSLCIGVGAGTFLGCEGFLPEFPQTCLQSFCATFADNFPPIRTLFSATSKTGVRVFFCKRWAPFLLKCSGLLPRFSTNQNFSVCARTLAFCTTEPLSRHEWVRLNQISADHIHRETRNIKNQTSIERRVTFSDDDLLIPLRLDSPGDNLSYLIFLKNRSLSTNNSNKNTQVPAMRLKEYLWVLLGTFSGFPCKFSYKFLKAFSRLNISEWPTQVKYRHYNICHDVSKIVIILNEILWISHVKRWVWKIIFFFHTSRPKNIFQTFPDWKMTNFSRLLRNPAFSRSYTDVATSRHQPWSFSCRTFRTCTLRGTETLCHWPGPGSGWGAAGLLAGKEVRLAAAYGLCLVTTRLKAPWACNFTELLRSLNTNQPHCYEQWQTWRKPRHKHVTSDWRVFVRTGVAESGGPHRPGRPTFFWEGLSLDLYHFAIIIGFTVEVKRLMKKIFHIFWRALVPPPHPPALKKVLLCQSTERSIGAILVTK